MNRPNIVFILLDQLRPDRLPYFKEFSNLKKNSIFFNQVITYAPYTVASVHALLSGMYGTHNGVDSYYGSLDFDSPNCFTLVQYLREAGYHTKADILSKIILPHQGFDEVRVHDEHRDDLRKRHKDLIKDACGSSPFFLFLHYSNIHTGIISEVVSKFTDFDEGYFYRYKENTHRYDGFVKAAAAYLEDVLEFCKQYGVMEDTLFVVLTDHGCSLGEKPGEKCYGVFTYDYTALTFAYFLYQSLLPKSKEINFLTRTIDIAPTILDILGIPAKVSYKIMQGVSLYPMILGNDSKDREAYIETAGLSGPNPSPYKPNICAYRTKDWKLIYNETTGNRELYDLRNDPKENTNLHGRYPQIELFLWNRIKAQEGRVILEE